MSQTISPKLSERALHDLIDRLLATRERDLSSVEAAHRDVIAADPELHRRLLSWLADNNETSVHLTVGLALLAVGPDSRGRQLARTLIGRLPIRTVCAVVDYVHGWKVDRVHTRYARARYTDSMSAAYAAGAAEVKAQLEKVASEADLSELSGGEILVTLGQYDRVQQVLDYLELPYRVISRRQVTGLDLRADQVLIVNCPGQFGPGAIEEIRKFVARGGTLITTDWALKTIIERAFPGIIEYNSKPTGDDVVEVSFVDPDTPYTRGVEVPGHKLQWWLEGASYPIRILDDRVRVLMRSDEMKNKYADDPLVVMFAYGEGLVFHLTSHYYLQRSKPESEAAAAYSSLKLLGNILVERRRACGV